ncbi:MAG: META domain-containing protein, partial [Saprospiraceae bacterium]
MSLIQLEYTIKNDGFVICKDENQAKNKVELLYLKECKRLPLAPSAIFFRRFYKEDNSTIPYHSEPSVCIFNTKEYFFNTEEHKVSGFSGCNNFFGSYKVDGNNISFSQMASTRKLCRGPVNKLEQDMLSVLNNTS